MTSKERIEREAAGYRWSDIRERKRLDALFGAWLTIRDESRFPLAWAIARYYGEKASRLM